jgi:hypothetical protein
VVELTLALALAGVIGLALTRLIISQSRFVALQDGAMRARQSARATLNIMLNELRMVTDSGVLAADVESVTVRVPYAFGVACQQVSGTTAVSIVPSSQFTWDAATPAGYAWRDITGAWRFVEPVTVATGAVALCTGSYPSVAVATMSGWGTQRVAVLTPNVVATRVGAPIYLYEVVTYRFAQSVELPGSLALWRRERASGLDEELVAPFHSSSRFEFIVGDSLGLTVLPPADLEELRGVRLSSITVSESTPPGRSEPSQFSMPTDIYFRNRAR